MYDTLTKSVIPPAVLAVGNAILAAVEQQSTLSIVATCVSVGWLTIAVYDRVLHLVDRLQGRKGK